MERSEDPIFCGVSPWDVDGTVTGGHVFAQGRARLRGRRDGLGGGEQANLFYVKAAVELGVVGEK